MSAGIEPDTRKGARRRIDEERCHLGTSGFYWIPEICPKNDTVTILQQLWRRFNDICDYV
jgi:hypothetical protein